MFIDPKKMVEQFSLIPGMKVADLGAGSGAYAVELARAVGGAGQVYAVDIQQELLARIKNQVRLGKAGNVEVIWGDLEKVGGTRLQETSIDFALASNILFQIDHKDVFCQEVMRILRKGGRLGVIDWKDSYNGLGPPAADVLTEPAARSIFEKAGFTYDHNVPAGDHHYGLIFKK
jgi:ubiquinone/menaquinone biosynthesis C-methylase UbiE